MKAIATLPALEGNALDSNLPQPGEAVVVIARDGTARFLTIAMSPEIVLEKMRRDEELTEEEETDLMVAGKAFALCIAANTDSVMAIIDDIASNPEIVNPAVLAGLGAGTIN